MNVEVWLKARLIPAVVQLQKHLTLILSIAAAVFVVGCLFGLLIIWPSSRARAGISNTI